MNTALEMISPIQAVKLKKLPLEVPEAQLEAMLTPPQKFNICECKNVKNIHDSELNVILQCTQLLLNH